MLLYPNHYVHTGFSFNADKPGMMDQNVDMFQSALKRVDVTFQNLDSSEISLTDVSHYYDSDPTKVSSNYSCSPS